MLEIQKLTVTAKQINALYRTGSLERASIFKSGDYDEGQFFLLSSEEDEKHTALAVAEGDKVIAISANDLKHQGITPRDALQRCFVWGLKRYPLMIGTGAAGTGKTTLALAFALHQLFRNEKKVVLTKPTVFIGGKSNAIAAVSGGIEEKMAPYMESYMIAMRKLLGDDAAHFIDEFLDKGQLVIQPLELVRGLNFENAVVILDEAQNTSPHELMSFISRVGEGSTCIILGDPKQIDVKRHWKETGLFTLLDSDAFYHSTIAKGIKMESQYRGPLATLAADVLSEFLGDEDEDDY